MYYPLYNNLEEKYFKFIGHIKYEAEDSVDIVNIIEYIITSLTPYVDRYTYVNHHGDYMFNGNRCCLEFKEYVDIFELTMYDHFKNKKSEWIYYDELIRYCFYLIRNIFFRVNTSTYILYPEIVENIIQYMNKISERAWKIETIKHLRQSLQNTCVFGFHVEKESFAYPTLRESKEFVELLETKEFQNNWKFQKIIINIENI